VKDVYARFQTMKGKKVERRFGWDCHGLPAEMETEKELGVSGRKAIEDYGIAQFNNACEKSVMKYTKTWEEYINRLSRWVDFENDYKTMDLSYMESVIWAFKQLYDKGLIYESSRVMPYSWAAETPLSNFETRIDNAYRQRIDKAITIAFELEQVPDFIKQAFPSSPVQKVKLLAWTTTPWTLPSNLALGVNGGMDYYILPHKKQGETGGDNGEYKEFIICHNFSQVAYDDKEDSEGGSKNGGKEGGKNDDEGSDKGGGNKDAKEITHLRIKGSDLVGLTYKPLFPYFQDAPNAFKILAADFVEEGSGTGIVHLAPGFGEDDQRVCNEASIPTICPVDDEARYTEQIYDLGKLSLKGLNVIAETEKTCPEDPFSKKQLQKYGLANLRIIQHLKQTGQLIAEEDYSHNYPHCWRTDTPLIYKAVPSYYVQVTKFKERMVQLNRNINWIPEHIKDGLFGKWLENARDWSISRNRFWGAPIPVWKSPSGKIRVFGSIAEIEEATGQKVANLHRPHIDELVFEEDGERFTRVSDVLDCWFESGSMFFASVHYPFENKDWFESHFPADFIVEYTAQTRGWFYTLMIMATALFDKEPFKNCICHGVILDEDKQKLSKRLRNYADPQEMFNKYGSDAMRFMMVNTPVMQGGELYIAKDGTDIKETIRLVIKPIWNAFYFFTLYANADEILAQDLLSKKCDGTQLKGKILDGKQPSQQGQGQEFANYEIAEMIAEVYEKLSTIDRYILAKLKTAITNIDDSLSNYNTLEACRAITDFFEVLNNWYIRRSRERFWRGKNKAGQAELQDKQNAYNVLYSCLLNMAKAFAPLMPALAEQIYTVLNNTD
jgi:isoleucyl-tRNA synthetase